MLDSKESNSRPGVSYLRGDEETVKIVVTGGFGVGKTTLIGNISEIRPLRTEEVMTEASVGTDDLKGLPDKRETTVAMDFGRRRLSESLVLYLFGAPGQDRFLELLPDLARGALGALVLVDTRRPAISYRAVDELEKLGLHYAVAVNEFPDRPAHQPQQLREAMALDPHTPLLTCNALDQDSCKETLIRLVTHVLNLHPEPAR